MANRVLDADVKVLVEVETGVDTTPFINTAHLLVEEELLDAGMSESRLTEIERYLAAHFVVLAKERGGLIRYVVGESSESYHTIDSDLMGFNTTRFGQQAMALDSSEILLSIGSAKLKAEFRVVGGLRS